MKINFDDEPKEPIKLINKFGDDLTEFIYDAQEDSEEEIPELAVIST